MKRTDWITVAIDAAVLALICCVLGLRGELRRVRAERDAFRINTEVLMGEVDTFRTKNGHLVAEVESLQLREKDYLRLIGDDAKEIMRLRDRNETLESVIRNKVESEVSFTATVHDTLIVRENHVDTLRAVVWEDLPWFSFRAEERGDSLVAKVTHHDEIDIAVFLKRRMFLFFKGKVKGTEVDVVSRNPYTTDMDVSSVRIVNRKYKRQ